jgi:hypothetical protein
MVVKVIRCLGAAPAHNDEELVHSCVPIVPPHKGMVDAHKVGHLRHPRLRVHSPLGHDAGDIAPLAHALCILWHACKCGHWVLQTLGPDLFKKCLHFASAQLHIGQQSHNSLAVNLTLTCSVPKEGMSVERQVVDERRHWTLVAKPF